ncbi:DUF6882 domain-containing protein [Pseudomonas sp. LRF_L74]|uniref:DUF6882 domain-containing protein n=1 Tax=Pseudomonas sp. LRF_L74 TaxID=3369422 RepID=UPI003F604928
MQRTLVAILFSLVSAHAMSQTPTQFIDAAREGLALQTSANTAAWHLGEEENWAADLDAGTLVFTFANGTTATAPIQVVGTYNQDDGTFLWGWDHPSVPEPLRTHAQLAKAWGQQNGVADFTTRQVECSEDEAWSFAAVANRLGGGNGVYRGPAGSTLVFMTLGTVTLAKAKH